MSSAAQGTSRDEPGVSESFQSRRRSTWRGQADVTGSPAQAVRGEGRPPQAAFLGNTAELEKVLRATLGTTFSRSRRVCLRMWEWPGGPPRAEVVPGQEYKATASPAAWAQPAASGGQRAGPASLPLPGGHRLFHELPPACAVQAIFGSRCDATLRTVNRALSPSVSGPQLLNVPGRLGAEALSKGKGVIW